MKHLLPEVGSDGIVLWRIRDAANRTLWCAFGKPAREFLLVVRNPVTRWTSVAELHPDRHMLLNRARELRDQYLAEGWRMVDAESTTVH